MTSFTKYLKEDEDTLHPFGTPKHALALKKKYPDAFKDKGWSIRHDALDKKDIDAMIFYFDKKELVRVVVEDTDKPNKIVVHSDFSIPFSDALHKEKKEIDIGELKSYMNSKTELNKILSEFDNKIKPFASEDW